MIIGERYGIKPDKIEQEIELALLGIEGQAQDEPEQEQPADDEGAGG
jgi:hypothetical protein